MHIYYCRKYAGHGPGISFGGFGTGNVPLVQGGTLQVPWNALQERGSRTRNFIRRIADPECSTRMGRYAASAVERTAENMGSRTRNFIRRITDPECSTHAGPYAASAVERTAVNTAASPLNA
ncbi:hypothetical protein B0H13DRAFT_1851546 [Mycena leptocephala]|nr:hypothetical protein B0H13DRAFT_1851546 [Mycena leptocephala]